jgi:hypothetical protein
MVCTEMLMLRRNVHSQLECNSNAKLGVARLNGNYIMREAISVPVLGIVLWGDIGTGNAKESRPAALAPLEIHQHPSQHPSQNFIPIELP